MLGGQAVPSLQLDLLKTVYDYAYLGGRKRAGVTLSQEEHALLSALSSALEPADADRRAHSRRITALPALLKAPAGTRSGFACNLSGGGMLVECAEDLDVGGVLRVRLGSIGETEYHFTCRVVRRDGARYGLRFEGVPLEIRYGSYPKTVERAGAAATDKPH
jgi:hypothetical protein